MADKPVVMAQQGILEVPPLFGMERATAAGDIDMQHKDARTKMGVEAYRQSVAFVKTDHGELPNGKSDTTAGTGFFVTKDGVMATDYHVVKDPKKGITVTTANGVVHCASLLSVDSATDLALLQVKPAFHGEVFQNATLAQASTLGSNQEVFTIGHPKRSPISRISSGHKNALVPLNNFELTDGLSQGEDPNRKVITTVMRAETGNSGGPLCRESDGAVVAILDFNSLENNLAISTPVEDLHRLLARTGVSQRRTAIALTMPLNQIQARESVDLFDATKLVVPQADVNGMPQGTKDNSPPSPFDRYSDFKTLPRKGLKPF